jgi:hypothetical protein
MIVLVHPEFHDILPIGVHEIKSMVLSTTVSAPVEPLTNRLYELKLGPPYPYQYHEPYPSYG